MAAFIFALLSLRFRSRGLSRSARHCVVSCTSRNFSCSCARLYGLAVSPRRYLGSCHHNENRPGHRAFILLSIAFIRQLRSRAQKDSYPGLYALCFLTVVAIGYFGGELVFGGRPAKEHQTPQTHAEAREDQGQAEIDYADVAGSDHGKPVIPGGPGKSERILCIKGKKEPAMPYTQEHLA